MTIVYSREFHVNQNRCGKREAECVCYRSGRHKIHRCECGGSWVYDAQGRMQPRSWPGGFTALDWAAWRMAGLL